MLIGRNLKRRQEARGRREEFGGDSDPHQISATESEISVGDSTLAPTGVSHVNENRYILT
jgi:hypothetical protein